MDQKGPTEKKTPGFVKRLIIIACCLFGILTLLIIQFFRIQITEEKIWQQRADKQHYFVVTEPFLRGTFYSNTDIRKTHISDPQPLVFDIKKYHLYVDALSIPFSNKEIVAKNIYSIIRDQALDKDTFFSQIQKKSRSRKLASRLDPSVRDLILDWWRPYAAKNKLPINAIYFVSDYQRAYPFGKLLGQTLHTIREKKDEVSKQAVPTGGLEYRFHSYLKGREGKRKMMRSPRHSFDIGEVIQQPENGCDIYLTVNHVLQAICEEEIERGVKEVKAGGGWAVMMDPRSGDILALAQYPFFYPDKYNEYFNDKTLIKHTQVRAATDAHEPASVTKAFTVAIALMANDELLKRGEPPLFDPEEKIAVADGTFPGRVSPIKDTKPAKYLNMDMAIQRSSNIYVGRLIQRVVNRLGNEWYRNALIETFGLGIKTGIELPSESPGVLPKPGRKYPNGKPEWSGPTPFSLAMGHNLQANSLQLLRAFAVFANGGYLVSPNLIRKIIAPDPEGGKTTLSDRTGEERKKEFPHVLSRPIVNRVVQSVKYVSKNGGGGRRGDVRGYTEAVKSGTAKKIINGKYSTEKYCASFIGFTPVENPAFVMIVVIDEPDTRYKEGVGSTYYGSVAAAPVFKRIAERSLEYLGIPPDDPYGYSPNDPRFDRDKADWVKQSMNLQEKFEMWNK